MANIVHCGQCSILLSEPSDLAVLDRSPCPACRSLRRCITAGVEFSTPFHMNFKVTQIRPGFKRRRKDVVLEMVTGDVPSVDFGHVYKEWVLDRGRNRYREYVVSPDGTVLRDEDHPLDQHRNYGAAKSKKQSETIG